MTIQSNNSIDQGFAKVGDKISVSFFTNSVLNSSTIEVRFFVANQERTTIATKDLENPYLWRTEYTLSSNDSDSFTSIDEEKVRLIVPANAMEDIYNLSNSEANIINTKITLKKDTT